MIIATIASILVASLIFGMGLIPSLLIGMGVAFVWGIIEIILVTIEYNDIRKK